MTNVLSLDAMRKEVDEEYADVAIDLGGGDIVRLQSVLRIPRDRRRKAYELIDELQESAKKDSDDEGSDFENTELTAAIALQLIAIVADDDDKANALIGAIEDDIPLVLELFNNWMESTQSGEAEGSES